MTRTTTSKAPGSGTSISSSWKASVGSPSRSWRMTQAAMVAGSSPGSVSTCAICVRSTAMAGKPTGAVRGGTRCATAAERWRARERGCPRRRTAGTRPASRCDRPASRSSGRRSPVMNVSGRKTDAKRVSRAASSLRRFDTLARYTLSVSRSRSRANSIAFIVSTSSSCTSRKGWRACACSSPGSVSSSSASAASMSRSGPTIWARRNNRPRRTEIRVRSICVGCSNESSSRCSTSVAIASTSSARLRASAERTPTMTSSSGPIVSM